MSEQGKNLQISEEAIPLLCESVDITKLDITPEEGFILSQIDGQVRIRHLIIMTGLGKDATIELIRKLVEKGAITLHKPREEKPKKEEKKEKPAVLIDPEKIPKGDAFKDYVQELVKILPQIDYFHLLGVGRDASRAEIKKAYFKLSKIFHPDRYYRKVEPEFRRQLQEVFKQINTAYQVLLDPKRKEEYLSQLKEKGIEEAGKELKLEVARKVYSGPKLKLGLRESKEKKKAEKLKKLTEKIKSTPMYAQIQKAERLYQLALEDIRRKNFKSARTNLKLAIQLDPLGGKRYQKELEKIDQLEKQAEAETLYEQASSAEKAGEYQIAYKKYSEALKISPDNPKILLGLARCMIIYSKNYEKARALILQVMELDEKKPEYYYLLGLVYKGLGQIRAAEVQFQKALELDPKYKQAQKELKSLRK